MKQVCKTFTLAVGLVCAGCVFSCRAADRAVSSLRPYEMEWAGRTADDRPPLCALVDTVGWTIDCQNAEATFTRATDRLLFGDGVARLTYRSLGGSDKPRVFVRPPAPIPIAGEFDAISCWVFGNNVFGRDPTTPSVTIDAQFIGADGRRYAVLLGHVHHKGWHKFHMRLPRDAAARARHGGAFDGFCVHGGRNAAFRSIDLNSFAVFKEELRPLSFAPRPRRGAVLFPSADQGLNTGAGKLPFPVSERTILPPSAFAAEDQTLEFRLPPADTARWDELAVRTRGGHWMAFARGGGVFPDDAARAAHVTFSRQGNCIVADVEGPTDAEAEAEIRFGEIGDMPPGATRTVMPYYTYRERERDSRPAVAGLPASSGRLFVSAAADWTQSGASLLFAATNRAALNGGARYLRKTDGRRNACHERFVWAFSPKIADVLPTIPNPPSPWKHVIGTRVWREYGVVNREKDLAYWRAMKRRGMARAIVTDHETAWRLNEEQSFTFRTRCEPRRGGDAAQRAYARAMIDDLGFVYGPYNNYVDLAPVNEYWSEDHVLRCAYGQNGRLQPGWRRCWRAKPAWAVGMCERLAPEIQRKFGFNCGYCDVHTCMRPWEATDYDARVPGAGSFAAAFYLYGEIMLMQKKTWGGPVFSEGSFHWIYSGLTDGNYAQDREYGMAAGPWIVDFDLLRIHPLSCNAGMGMINGHFYATPGTRPQDPDEAIDRYLAAIVAFGHSGMFVPERHASMRDYRALAVGSDEFRSYYMIQALAARYTQADVTAIRYMDASGRLLTTEDAVADGTVARSQVMSTYSDGTTTVANGSADEPLECIWDGMPLALPPNGFAGMSGDRRVRVWNGMKDGHRAEFAVAPDYTYLNGRGVFTVFPEGGTDGICVRLPLANGTEDVVTCGATRIELPYVARRIEALDESGRALRDVPIQTGNGRTVIAPSPDAVSYRVTREAVNNQEESVP